MLHCNQVSRCDSHEKDAPQMRHHATDIGHVVINSDALLRFVHSLYLDMFGEVGKVCCRARRVSVAMFIKIK